MKRLALIAAVLATAAPLYAGIVYVPVAKVDPSTQGIGYETRLVLVNQGEVTRRATPSLIALNADGTNRPLEVFPAISVPANGTVVVADLLRGERAGLIELALAPQLLAQAQLVTRFDDGSEILGAAWPIVSSDSLVAAGQTLHLQGWERSSTTSTDFGLMNLGHNATSCGVDVFRADGSQLGHWNLGPAALSFSLFRDVLATIGVTAGAQLRAAITCDQPFYAFAAITDSLNHDHSVVVASALGTSELDGGGGGGGGGGTCIAGHVCFDAPGAFHTVQSGAQTKIFNATVPTETSFSSLSLDFDFRFTGWYGPEPDGEHNFFWINRGGFVPPSSYPAWTNNVYGYANARGPNRYRVTLVHNINLGQNATTFLTTNAGLTPGVQYHISYTYNHPARTSNLQVTAGGTLVAQIIGVTTGHIYTGSHEAFMLYFGNVVGHGQETPWANGTQFMNLVYRMYP